VPVSLDSTIAQSPLCLSADVEQEVVLMAVERGLYFALDPIGSDVWRRIAQPRNVKDLCGALLADYDAPLASIETDVLALLDTLAEAGVVDVK